MEKIFCNNVDDEAAQSTNVDGSAPKDGCGEAVTLRKGAWTLEEDEILKEYVKKNGEGDWGSVPNKCGLARCGKSCRLRWNNYLNPNLKKTAFSEDEEKIIVDLHAKLGNKWSRMAARLPGRTDNEIKNFWNTRTSRLQRAGLPIYPPEVQKEAAAYHLLQENYGALNPNATTFSFSSLLSSSYSQKLQKSYHYSLENPEQTDSANYTNPFTPLNFSNENNGLRLSSASPQINPSFPASNSAGIDSHGDFNPSAVALGSPYEHLSSVHNSNSDFFFSQISGSETAASSYSNGVDNGLKMAVPPSSSSSNSSGIDSHGGFNPSAVALGSPYEHLSSVHNSNSDFFLSQTSGSETAASSSSNGVDNGLNMAMPPSSSSSNSAGIDSHGGFTPSTLALGSPYEHFSFVHNSNSDFFSSQTLGSEIAASSYSSGVDNGLNMAVPPSSSSSNSAGIDSHGGFNPSAVALGSPYEHFSFVHNSNLDFSSGQTLGSGTAALSCSSGVDNGLNMAVPPSSSSSNSAGIDSHGGVNLSAVALGYPYEHLSSVHNSNSDFFSSQTLGSGTAASSYSSGVDNGLNMAVPTSSSSSNSAGIDSHGAFNPSAVALGSPYKHFSFVHHSNSDFFSGQTLGLEIAASSYSSGADNVLNMADPPPTNSGMLLLDALVAEEDCSITLQELYGQGRNMVADAYAQKEDAEIIRSLAMKNFGDTDNEKQKDVLSSSVSLTGTKRFAEEPLELMDFLRDDNLDSLLNNFGTEMPMPQWYLKRDEGQSVGVESSSVGTTNQDLVWSLGTIETCYNNLPLAGICIEELFN